MQPLTMSRHSAQRLAAQNLAAAPARSCRRLAHVQHPLHPTSNLHQPSQLVCRAADMPDPAEQQQQQQQKLRRQSHQEQQQQRRFQELLAELQQLSFQELQQLCNDSDASHAAFSATFLFWLQEKAAGGQQKQALASLAAQLVYLKEAADAAASRRLLPSLASSLAYSNYSSWRQQHPGQDLPDVAPGVSLTQLLKAAEREEARLKQWQSPQRPASSLDSFADVSGYKQLAAQAIERARARFRGYNDDDDDGDAAAAGVGVGGASAQQQQQRGRASPAAEAALQELLVGCCCREERATMLPQAFLPPGLQVSAGSDGKAQGLLARAVTTPQRMLAAIQQRLGEAPPAAGGPVAALALQQQEQLPSGELLQQVLHELQEDVQEYERHVYRRMSARDLYDRM